VWVERCVCGMGAGAGWGGGCTAPDLSEKTLLLKQNGVERKKKLPKKRILQTQKKTRFKKGATT